jgi:hypothetical protein
MHIEYSHFADKPRHNGSAETAMRENSLLYRPVLKQRLDSAPH